MRTTVFFFAILLMASPMRVAAQPDPVFDLKAVLAPALKARLLKTTEKIGIVTEEVMFHSEMDGAKSVDIFAYFSYPKGAKQLPAFIWNQGGLDQATTYWTEFGAKRGYATLCIDFPMPGYRSTGGYPIVSGLELPEDPKKAPIYHGAVALLRAVSFLESRAEVDKNKIGMAGSSWGGFYTTLMVGVDPRLKCGSSMFGCGALDKGNLWWDGRGWDKKRDAAFRARWAETLDPAWRLKFTKTPIAWFTGTNDQFYWLPSVLESFAKANGPKHLSLLPNYQHALTPPLDEQVFAWLDVHLRKAPAFVEVTRASFYLDGKGGLFLQWIFKGPRKIVAAEVWVNPEDEGNWANRVWHRWPADPNQGSISVKLPQQKTFVWYFGTVIDADGFHYSTPLTGINTEGPPARSIWDYDGCAMWGGWEQEQITYLSRHGLPIPPLSKDAKEGKQAVRLQTGKYTLPPILFTTGVQHRVSCWLKADKAAEVTLTVRHTADGKEFKPAKTIKVGLQWTEVELDFTPPPALTGGANLLVEVPTGVTVLMDAVRCRPILKNNPK